MKLCVIGAGILAATYGGAAGEARKQECPDGAHPCGQDQGDGRRVSWP